MDQASMAMIEDAAMDVGNVLDVLDVFDVFDGGNAMDGRVVAVVLGVAFGVALERAGLGRAPKLAGQFFATDFTVFKVMFSAVVTAMLGTFWLTHLGVANLSDVYVPETHVAPQLVGGAIFGVGFVVSGLCPGTSCVAAASGRLDGLATMLGLWLGVLATGAVFDSLLAFYEGTTFGLSTIPVWLGRSQGLVVCVIVGIALASFQWLAWIEERRRT